MKKLIAVALSSTALLASPAIFAQTTAPASTGGQGTGVGNENAPLTPSQTQTSEGAVYNPPPIDHSGNAKHLTDKGMTGKDGDSGSMGTDSGNNGGTGGPGTGGTGDGTGTGTGGDGTGTGTGNDGTGGAGAGAGGDGSSGGGSGGGN